MLNTIVKSDFCYQTKIFWKLNFFKNLWINLQVVNLTKYFLTFGWLIFGWLCVITYRCIALSFTGARRLNQLVAKCFAVVLASLKVASVMFYYLLKPHSSLVMNFNFLILDILMPTKTLSSLIASHAKTEHFKALFQTYTWSCIRLGQQFIGFYSYSYLHYHLSEIFLLSWRQELVPKTLSCECFFARYSVCCGAEQTPKKRSHQKKMATKKPNNPSWA